MTYSLILTDTYKLNIINTRTPYIEIDEHQHKVKDLTAIRYRFKEYSTEQLTYIKENQAKFRNALHILEIALGDSIPNIENTINYLYIPITQSELELKDFTEHTKQLMQNIPNNLIERVMLKDETNSMTIVELNNFKKKARELTGRKDIGICGSPYSTGEDSCLCAMQARKLIAKYIETPSLVEMPLQAHECNDECSCIKHIELTSDTKEPTEEPIEPKPKSTKPPKKSNKPMIWV